MFKVDSEIEKNNTPLTKPDFASFDVLGVKMSAVNLDLADEVIHHWIRVQYKTYVAVVSVNMIIECRHNRAYLEAVNNAGMATPDGMPLVWLGRCSGSKIIQRTYGPDLMPTLCARGQERGYKHYLYGGTEQTLYLLVKKLKEKFPSINIAGAFAPPFRPLTEEEDANIIKAINTANPDILWVGLGVPKQDVWAREHRSKLDVPVIISVGAAFDFLSGVKPQAPRWMQKSGLEWFFRLCCEPKRLWKRYLVRNTEFIFLLIVDWIKKRLLKGK